MTYIHHDQYGSTRLTTNQAAVVVGTSTYSAFGRLVSQTGTSVVLGWNGQYSDVETGFTYLRARYFDPLTAQFLSSDPLAALTQSVFGYAANDPINLSDPRGLDWWNPTTWSSQTWAGVGVGLGMVALAATGVGLIADLGIVGTAVAGATAAAAGLGATVLDYGPCVNEHSAAACGGLIMGAGGLIYGTGGFAADLLGEEGLAAWLGTQSMLIGGTGLVIDALAFDGLICK